MQKLLTSQKHGFLWVFMFMLLLSSGSLLAQNKLITGKVTSDSGETMPGVSILVKGSTLGTTTDIDGNYSISAGEGDVLVFSFIGMQTKEIAINSSNMYDVTLETDISQLDEVLVVGYGTTKKSDLTGSVSSVKAAELTAFPVANATQALQGRAAGVSVQSNNGDPGGSLKVRIRGGNSINASSDPLYVVDGFIGGTLPAPEDIQSIEVLKDASATAIYGSRGANGVIMVTTKRGKIGKAKVDFNTSYSSQEVINRIDMLNANQFLDYTREVIPNYVDNGADTDWQDQIFRAGGIQNYQVSVSGGSDVVNYYVSGSFFDQKGIILNSGFERYAITSNLNFKASDKISVGVNLLARRTGRDGVVTQEGSGGAGGAGVVGSALRFMPDLPVRNEDGTFTLASIGDPIDNPFAVATERQQETIGDLFQSNFYLNYDIVKNLSFKTTLGFRTDNNRTGTFVPTTLYAGANVGGDATIGASKNTDLISENYFTYNLDLNTKHKFNFVAGYSFQKSNDTDWSSGAQSFITNSVSFWNLQGGAVQKIPSSGFSETQIQSVFGRINYSFNDKYLFTVNARYDGSSNFSKNNKYAFFPSGAFAWNMKDEGFMKDVNFVSDFKWRVSYGLTGNQAIGPYQTLARFSNSYTIIDGVAVNAVRPTTVANDDLTWETTRQFDFGADMSFLNNRLNLTADYYRSVTSDLLFSVPLPTYTGYSSQLQNLGKVENKGIEFTLNTVNTTGALKWNTSFNISINRNKVLELPDGNDILYGSGPGHLIGLGQTQILRVGEPVGSFFGWVYDGVYQQGDDFLPGGGFEQVAGGEKFRDIDGEKDANGALTGNPNGALNADDRTVIGNGQAKFIWGLNNDFSFKGFDLNIFFQGSQGNQILSYSLLEIETLSGSNNSTTRALDRWTPTNTDTDVPKRTLQRSQRVSSHWVFDGSYVRLKNISLGYSLPSSILEKLSISKARFYVSAQNILTFTEYKGFDPEVNYNSGGGAASNRNLGLDYASYPNAKSYTIGLNVSF
ncbi:SusC/RagA family TonB-linked outer membrane protein [Algoriphagus antarcticus]|uniref:TonB-linked SusC/RagA family outer membrane protein n=1 Tax=Algoriphagus antarcticus TaxID=238540 RepID=A0A3E0DHJ1_9BACT|nr:TonB-dependent receptor [Algoriphagus antarcticus]REG82067.1 TonB-linked SusC/RagA family outer membrane protein [Algoriphagus antarcticus]